MKHIAEVHMKTANKDKSSEKENMTIKACNICKKRGGQSQKTH